MLPSRAIAFATFVIGYVASDGQKNTGIGATDTPSCTGSSPGESEIAGFEFLQEEKLLYLVSTSVQLLQGYHVDAELGINISCVTVQTTDKDLAKHEVTLAVYYKDGSPEGKGGSFGQRFGFQEKNSKDYNIMKSLELSGAPSGEYHFEYTTRDCAVVLVPTFGERMSEDSSNQAEEVEIQSRDEDMNEDANEDLVESQDAKQCMVFATDNNPRALENCCEKYFHDHCQKNKNYQYTPRTCPSPLEARAEL